MYLNFGHESSRNTQFDTTSARPVCSAGLQRRVDTVGPGPYCKRVIYEHLFRRAGDKPVRVSLIGTGDYGVSLLVSLRRISRTVVTVVCDRSLDAARAACRAAGVASDQVVECSSASQVEDAVARGAIALVEDAMIAIHGPCDVVVECTGAPEAGAVHAMAAIDAHRHVAMVNKETDGIVGPILARRAAEAGVVYTPVDGDQHGLLTGLVMWAQTLGLRIISGGKARETDFVYDDRTGTVGYGRKQIELGARAAEILAPIAAGEHVTERVGARRDAMIGLPFVMPADLCEMAIAANHTGLLPDRPELWAPVLRTNEVPGVFCTRADGGIFDREGRIDVFGCLRRADEAGQMGGEFIVVAVEDAATRDFLGRKGLVMNTTGTAAMIYRPLHLLGAETAISILCAALLGIPTGATDVTPRVDLVGRARRAIAPGTMLGPETIHTGELLEPLLVPAKPIAGSNPAPLYLAQSCEIIRPLAAGTVVTIADIGEPSASRLWELRREQDRAFLG
ncbi:MAG: flagellar biosynthesis protein FlgA [Spirochaetaceae bacterium]|nr:MAG: flagellar biosynthesis protein FlgA [Spirochaetaceae bacterium]